MLLEYDKEGAEPGRIRHIATSYSPLLADMLREKGTSFIDTTEAIPVDIQRSYVLVGGGSGGGDDVRDRPVMPLSISGTTILANGHDAFVVLGIPPGATLSYDGSPAIPIGDTSLEIAVDIAGTYTLLIECWPYMPWSGSFEAVASIGAA